MENDINSSDAEFSPVRSKLTTRPVGQDSIQKLIDNATSLRLASKKTVKQLEFGSGAPGTRYKQELWVERFNKFRTIVLGKSIDDPFNGEDVLRFFDSIITVLKPASRGKPAPSKKVVLNGVKILLNYGTFTYPETSGYKFTARDGQRLQVWIDDAVKAGRLTAGLWQQRVWITFTLLSRMAKAWLRHYEQQGTCNWDIVIAKVMSIVLLSALGARAGDVMQSRGYTDMEYMQWKHIELKLVDDGSEPASFKNLKARITIEFRKGFKSTPNDNTVVYLRPLTDAENLHMCPISLLLTHALRHGLVYGSTIADVLENAARNPTSAVTWLYPERPVCAAFSNHRVVLDKVANINQPTTTLKEMGILSNILSRVHSHALRSGAAKDVAHLPAAKENSGFGFVTNDVRQFLGHTQTSFVRGTTQNYIGEASREFYNDRAIQQYTSPWQAKFSDTSSASAYINKPVDEDEILAWQKTANESSRRNAINNIRKERHNEWITNAPAEKSKKNAVASAAADLTLNIDPKLLNEKPVAATGWTSDSVDPALSIENPLENTPVAATDWASGSIDPRLMDENFVGDIPITAIDWASGTIDPMLLSNKPLENIPVAATNWVSDSIDLRFMDEDFMGDMPVDVAELNALENQVLSTGDFSEINEGQQMTRALFEDLDQNSADAVDTDAVAIDRMTPSTPIDFISQYARINIVHNAHFVDQWPRYNQGSSFEDSIGRYSLKGNSRDEPTPFELSCSKTPECVYKALRISNLKAHERICNQKYVETMAHRNSLEKTHQCSHAKCSASYTTHHALVAHIRHVHKWTPIPCQHGCDPNKLYTNQKKLSDHNERFHSGRWPTPCLFPGCASVKNFNDVSAYSKHLSREHQLDTQATRTPYFPKKPEESAMKTKWEPIKCPIGQCTSKTPLWRSRAQLKNHLTQTHDKSEQEANDLTAIGLVTKLASELPSRKRKTDATEKEESGKKQKM